MNGRDENEIAVVKLILPEQSLHYRDEIEIVVTLIIILGRRRNENESGLETSKPKVYSNHNALSYKAFTSYCFLSCCFADPAEIVSAPLDQQIVEGSGIVLLCNATGNPQPSITWTKQGNKTVLSTSVNLNLVNLTREDNGAVYNCKVQNSLGSAEANATITVWCKY